jgi:hypothetical protein
VFKRTGVEGAFICIRHFAVRQKVHAEPTTEYRGALQK